MKNEKPRVVRIHDVNIDAEYVQWISELKNRYQSAQIKAALKVNSEKLRFNWELGRDLVIRKAEEKWGAGIVEQLSLDLTESCPESKGFSAASLWRMKQWYLFYTTNGVHEKLAQAVRELQVADNKCSTKLAQTVREINQQLANGQNESDYPEIFGLVPWGHHIEIVEHCKDIDEALFYIAKTIERGWSRDSLSNCIKGKLYQNSGKAITNFADKLPSPQSEYAQEVTKDNYDFGFLILDDGYKEEALEDALEKQLTRFLLELGTGFAYLGRQKELIIAGKTRRIDMLFFHIHLNCYIVIELKAVPFQPEFAGKLNFYVNAVDDLIKTPSQNPTIGLLICKNKDETDVQYAFNGITTPMGVASYDNVKIREIQKQLPTIEQLKERIRLLEDELQKKQ